MMVKRLLPLITALALLAGGRAAAVELGDLTLTSNSDEPLVATISLLDVQGLDAEAIRVMVAEAEDFERLSLERDPVLDNLQFDVNLNAAGGPIVTLSAPVTIDEPFISLLLDTRWPSGRVLTEYTLRLEAPAFTAQTGNISEFSPVRSVVLDVPEEEPQAPVEEDSGEQAETAPAPTLAETSVTADSAASADAVAQPDEQTPANNVSSEPATPTPDAAGTPDPELLANASTLTVNAGDTLWELALRARPDSSVSVQQTMLALQRLNPEAFIGGNINQVQRGAVLRVPELDEIRRLANAEAVQEVQRQNQAFANRGTTPQPTQPATSTASGSTNQGELRVVAVDEEDEADDQPDTSAAGNQDAERERRLNELEDRLAVRQEELDELDSENRELNARLDMLQQQIASAQEIIRLRDLELVQLQESLADQDSAPADQADQPDTVVTMAPEGGPVQQFLNMMISNTWLLLSLLAALVLSIVAFLVWRNRAARAAEQESQRSNDEMKLGDEDSDELLFAGVAAAAAEADASRQADSVVDADGEAAAEQGESDDDDGVVYTPSTAAATMAQAYEEVESEQPDEDQRDEEQDDDPWKMAEDEATEAPMTFDDESAPEDAIVQSQGSDTQVFSGDDLSDADSAWDDTDASAYDLDDEFDLNQPEESTVEVEPASSESDFESELDAELDWPGQEQSFESEPEPVAEPEPEPEPESVMEPEPEPIPEPEPETTAIADDYDLSEPDVKAEASPSSTDEFDDLAFIPSEEMTEDDAAEEEDDFPLLSDSDEAATKLDLARAYIDMGDEAGAREILGEVLDEGTETQRQEAQSLLDRLE